MIKLKTLILERPPISIFTLFIFILSLSIFGYSIKFKYAEFVEDIASDLNWNKLSESFRKIEFCLSSPNSHLLPLSEYEYGVEDIFNSFDKAQSAEYFLFLPVNVSYKSDRFTNLSLPVAFKSVIKGHHFSLKGDLGKEKLGLEITLPSLRSKFPKCFEKNIDTSFISKNCSNFIIDSCIRIIANRNLFSNLQHMMECPAKMFKAKNLSYQISWHKDNVLNKYSCGADTSTLKLILSLNPTKPSKLSLPERFRIARNLLILAVILLNSTFVLLCSLMVLARPCAIDSINISYRFVFLISGQKLSKDFLTLANGILQLNPNIGERLSLGSLSVADEAAAKILELRKKARAIQVSTEDVEVKAYLRQLNEPICLFGEDPANRRDRLKMLLAISGGPAQRPALGEDGKPLPSSAVPARDENVVWYHEGSNNLRNARMMISKYSLVKARDRLKLARRTLSEKNDAQRKALIQERHKEQQTVGLSCSQVGDTRPIVYCNFSPDGSHIATASWSGLCKIWSTSTCELVSSLRGHSHNASCIRWHPRSMIDQSKSTINLASSSHDGSVKLWSLDSEEPLMELDGHAPHRVSRLAFHPSGRFLGTTCHDKSWRLWDLEIGEEILHQEGHSKAVYDIAFHMDGSLALTGSLDSYGRMWDLRTGRCIMFLAGHLEDCIGVDLAVNGWHALTCSVDNTVRLWDLRQQQTIYVIPAHKSVVSSARFEPQRCDFIVTSSFDGTAKIWGHPVWAQLRLLDAHSGKVSFADISPDGSTIVTCSHDLTFKIWNKGSYT